VPITSAELPRKAKRPLYSVLDASRYEHSFSHQLRPWHEALDAYLMKIIPAACSDCHNAAYPT